MVAPVEYFETSFWSKSKEFQNYLAIYSSSCQKFAPHRRLLCLDFHWNFHKKREWSLLSLTNPGTYFETYWNPCSYTKADQDSSSFFHAHWKRRKTPKHPALCRVQLTAGEVNFRLYEMVNLSDQQRQVDVNMWRCVYFDLYVLYFSDDFCDKLVLFCPFFWEKRFVISWYSTIAKCLFFVSRCDGNLPIISGIAVVWSNANLEHYVFSLTDWWGVIVS